jgi:formylglycine-generating enzyme required for sulfatase activity
MTEESKVQGATPHIFNDEPVRGGEKAYFQFEAYANTLARLIAARSTRTPLTVGIFGEWGTGKTTLMQAIQARLQETEKLGDKKAKISFLSPVEYKDYRRCRTVWFNAWKYSGRPEESLVALIQAVLRQMRDDGFINKVYAALSQPKRPHLRVAEASLHILSQIFSAGQVEIDLSKFETQSRFQQNLPFLDEFQIIFDRLLLWYLRREIKGEPDLSEATLQQRAQLDQEGVLVIFIDDLDRCLPSKTVQVLEAIKLMIGRPGTVFVLGASERVVQEAIRTHYQQVEKVERETDCQQYLEKLIQVRFPLPPLRQEDVQTFVSELLQGRPDEEVATLRQNLPLIAVGVPTNPRRLKTFVNFVELQWAFLVNSGQAAGLSKDVLTRWLVLDAAEPEFTKFVRELAPTNFQYEPPIDGRLRFVQNALRLARGEKVDTAAEYDRWPRGRCRRLWELLSQKGFTFDLRPGELDRLIHLSAPPVQAMPEEKAPPAAPEAARPARERPEKAPAGLERITWLPALVRVPAGPFLMGSDKKQDPNAYDDESPQHLENSIIKSYLIGKYPVTNADFARFVQATSYQTAAEKPGAKGGYIWVGTEWKQVEGANWQHPEGPQSSIEGLMDHPVVQIAWHDAMAYCKWLTEQINECAKQRKEELPTELQELLAQPSTHSLMVRLSTEAEWEKAARGEDGRLWPWGNQFDPKKCNSAEGKVGQTTPVGQYSPGGDSPYGCADMAGNVWEWCQSKWVGNYKNYDRGVQDRESLEGSDPRVLRGGSFGYGQRLVRCAYRNGDYPDYLGRNFGFRLVVSPL